MAKIKFDIPADDEKPSTITFKLQKTEVEFIEGYTKFLCEKHKKKIEKEVVLRGLLKPLFKDKEYLEFMKQDPQRIGAVSEKKEDSKKSSKKTESETTIGSPSV